MQSRQRTLTFSLAAAALFLGTACKQHVVLNAPSGNAPPMERMEAYERLHPLSMHETHVTQLRNGVPVGAYRTTDYLQLADGTRVYLPEDILPVVDPNTPAAAAARRSEQKRKTANTFSAVAWSTLLAGGALMIASIATYDPLNDEQFPTGLLVVGAGLEIGSLAFLFPAMAARRHANDEAATAFETYDKGLRKNLDLCVEGEQLGPCGATQIEPVLSRY